MPLYLVRWPNFSAALVTARDEADLIDQLDMLEDPSGCRWQVYQGPLHIEIDLPINFDRKHDSALASGALEDRYLITTVPQALGQGDVTLSVPSTDTSDAMLDAIWQFAFPNMAKAIADNDYRLTADQVAQFAVRDLDVLARSDWQRAQLERSADPHAKIARNMNTSIRQVKNILASRTQGAPAPVEPLKPKGRRKKRRKQR
jgi:hypothetical protein